MGVVEAREAHVGSMGVARGVAKGWLGGGLGGDMGTCGNGGRGKARANLYLAGGCGNPPE